MKNLQLIRQYAREMSAELPAVGQTQRTLPNGLYLQLLGRNGHRTLIIGHPDYQPDIEDAQQIASLFQIPEYTEPVAGPQRVASRIVPNVKVRAMTYGWQDADAERAA